MKALVGHTGFVGSNLVSQTDFDFVFNSSNIQQAFGLCPDILVYSGMRAEKFLANSFPEKDVLAVEQAMDNIQKINPKKLVLISTVDVYPDPQAVHEDSPIDKTKQQAYGKNRLLLEEWVKSNFEHYLIVRLPGLFGKGIKKNFIYDMIHIIPSMLKEEKFLELSQKNPKLLEYYVRNENAFYSLRSLTAQEKSELKQLFLTLGFSALNFTDSRASFQFYDLKHIWKDIELALPLMPTTLNFATEPISISEIYQEIFHKDFKNELSMPIPHYDFRTNYGKLYGGDSQYMRTKSDVLKGIKEFVNTTDK